MGIKERITDLQETKRIRVEEERSAEQTRKEQRQEQYQREIPRVLKKQKRLFNELKAMGVTGMIDEMIYPDHLYPLVTREEQLTRAKRLDERMERRAAKLPKKINLNSEKFRRRMRERDQQQWWGGVNGPRQNEDGSLDSTLRISIANKTDTGYSLHPTHGMLREVFLSYSKEGLLTIKGTETTFEATVNRNNVDRDAVETALAQAFHNPHIPQRDIPPASSAPIYRLGPFAS